MEDKPDYFQNLAFKKIQIKGFSIFCDWENVKNPKNGGIDIAALNSDHKKIFSQQQRVKNIEI